MTTSTAGQPTGSESRTNATDDLKSLPLPELMAKLGSSPDGLTKPRRNAGWRSTDTTR